MWESAGSQDPGYISLQHNEPLLQSGGREKKNRKRECATSQTFTSALPRPFIIISVTMLFSLLKKRGDFK